MCFFIQEVTQLGVALQGSYSKLLELPDSKEHTSILMEDNDEPDSNDPGDHSGPNTDYNPQLPLGVLFVSEQATEVYLSFQFVECCSSVIINGILDANYAS